MGFGAGTDGHPKSEVFVMASYDGMVWAMKYFIVFER